MAKEINYNNGQKKFELFIVDSDTALYQAARMVEEDYVIIKSKLTDFEMEFKNKTTFQGTARKGDVGGELKRWCDFLGVSRNREDFEITQHVRLKPDIDNHLEEAEKQFAYFVKGIKDLNVADDYKLCLGGKSNFRYEAAKILPYKGSRTEKPIVFADLKDKILTQYKSKVIVAENCEADDDLGIFGAKNQAYFRKHNKYKYLLGYIDKDIKQIWGPTLYLNKKELGIQFISPFEAAHHFAYQVLKGDLSVDNIQGLPDLALETKEKYGLRKAVGCGDVAATTVLSSCKDIKSLFEKVVECYQAYYQEPKEIAEGINYDWKDFLRENALLLWMQRKKDQRFDFFEDLCKPLEIKL